MRYTISLIFGCIGLATAGLVLAYAWVGWWPGSLVWLACGSLWAYGQYRKVASLAPLGMVAFVVGAVIGLMLKQPPLLLLIVVVAVLSAWDLDYFAHRLNSVERVDQAAEIEYQHLRRLLVVDGAALLFTGGALFVRAQFGFALVFWLGLLAFIGLSRLLKFLQTESD